MGGGMMLSDENLPGLQPPATKQGIAEGPKHLDGAKDNRKRD
jgi:hypothetical protein